jgi:hypothetical protein
VPAIYASACKSGLCRVGPPVRTLDTAVLLACTSVLCRFAVLGGVEAIMCLNCDKILHICR